MSTYGSAPVVGARSPRWALWKWLLIPDYANPERTYLKRLRIIQTPWFGVYLHWIYLPDGDRDPHDHPWPFASFVVRGGYTELVHLDPRRDLTRTRTYEHGRFSWHTTEVNVAHRILALKPNTITMLFVGRRSREWGFWETASRNDFPRLLPVRGRFTVWTDYEHATGLGPDPFDS